MAWFVGLTLAAALLLGGGTRSGFLGDAICQAMAVPLLMTSLLGKPQRVEPHQWARLIPALVLVALAILQLTPLPPVIALALPGRDLAQSAFEVAGTAANWHPLSLTPAATASALLSLLPPLAVFMGVTTLDSHQRRNLIHLILVLTALSLVIGLLQVAQGPASPLRFFSITNPTEAVGFFANRNHFAAQLYSALVFTGAALALSIHDHGAWRVANTAAAIRLAALAILLIGLVGGLAIARSRAGIFLSMAAFAGIVLIFWSITARRTDPNAPTRSRRSRFLFGLIALAVLIATQFGLQRILSRFEDDPLADLRLPLATTTFEAALAALPFGTGIGSFIPVYAHHERTSEIVSGFANRAHNDYAEWLLEAGLVAVVLLIAFLVWYSRQTLRIWRKADRDPDTRALQQAATVVLALLLLHTIVDYPLRTTAMATLFAFCCGMLVPPPRSHHRPTPRPANPQHDQHARNQSPRPRPNPMATPARAWHPNEDWPAAWRSNPASNKGDNPE